ncbi:MAG: hypothetical protein AABW93_03950, partial [Nanoarchaeota archaeon]
MPASIRVTKQPEWGGIAGPIWWHHHGTKVIVKSRVSEDKTLILGSRNAAVVEISKCMGREGWHVSWGIKFGTEEKVQGTVWMSTKNLRCAFGLLDEEDYDDSRATYLPWRNTNIERYGGTCFCQGQFIRYEDFLNIPGPGTGNDGDP